MRIRYNALAREELVDILKYYETEASHETAVDFFSDFEKVKRRIAETNMENRIALLGERPQDEVPLWFRRIALYVAPMRNEGFGLTPLEAMASGAAVVATRTGAAPYLVAEGVTGFLRDTADDLAAALGRLDEIDPSACRRRVEDLFSGPSMVRGYEAIFRSVTPLGT